MSLSSFFCCCCGTKTENNTVHEPTTGGYNLNCRSCEAGIRFYIPQRPTKTEEEAIGIFESTELTDRRAVKLRERNTKRNERRKNK